MHMMINILLACLFLIGATCDGLQQGDLCGIEGSNFLDDNFTGTIAVAGEGCVSQPTTPTVYAHRTLMILEACPGSLFNVTVKFYSAQRTAKFVPTRYQ